MPRNGNSPTPDTRPDPDFPTENSSALFCFFRGFFFAFFWPPYHVSWPRGAPPAWLKDESTLWLMQPARRIPSTEFCRATPVCYRFRHAHLRSSCSRSSCSSARTEKKTTSVGDRDFAIVFFASHGRRGCRRRPLGGAGVAPSGGIGWRPAWPRLRSVAIWRPWRATPAVHLCVGRPSAFSVAVVGVRVRLSSIRSFFLLHSPPPFPLSSSPPPPPPLLLLPFPFSSSSSSVCLSLSFSFLSFLFLCCASPPIHQTVSFLAGPRRHSVRCHWPSAHRLFNAAPVRSVPPRPEKRVSLGFLRSSKSSRTPPNANRHHGECRRRADRQRPRPGRCCSSIRRYLVRRCRVGAFIGPP